MAISGVACLQGGQSALVFYPLGYPTPDKLVRQHYLIHILVPSTADVLASSNAFDLKFCNLVSKPIFLAKGLVTHPNFPIH
jgi:hypothetical protein